MKNLNLIAFYYIEDKLRIIQVFIMPQTARPNLSAIFIVHPFSFVFNTQLAQ